MVWAEFATALELYNRHRSSLASLISYQTTRQIDAVPQSAEGAQFEVASEFGVPQATDSRMTSSARARSELDLWLWVDASNVTRRQV